MKRPFYNAVSAPQRRTLEKTEDKTDLPWKVVVLDDPVNLMEYVTRTLMKIFAYSRPVAEKMMMEIHEKGRAIVWHGLREKAEMYVQKLHYAQLKAFIEKDE